MNNKLCTYGGEMWSEEVVLAESEEYVGLSYPTIPDNEYFGQVIVPEVISFHLKV